MSDTPTNKTTALDMRFNADASLDEVVAEGASFHLEKMGDTHWWMWVQCGDKGVHINLTARGKIKASYLYD